MTGAQPTLPYRIRAEFRRWGNRLLLGLNLVVLAGGLWVIGAFGVKHDAGGWSYQDLVSILLTAIGVLLAIVALFVAFLAIWGYTTLKELAANIARDAAEKEARRVAASTAETVAARTAMSTRTVVESRDELQDALKATNGDD